MTPEKVETVLAEFRSWLSQAAAATPGTTAAETPATVDLHTLLSQFIALRHEVNLQTRAARAQQEQNSEALRHLSQALEALQQAADETRQVVPDAQEEILRPLLKTLVDVADALDLARRKMLQAQEGAWPLLDRLRTAGSNAGAETAASSWWGKWFGRRRPETASAPFVNQPHPGQEAADQVRELLESLIQGYTMSLQRIERALGQYGLERIDCVGQPFDPEKMEVMDVVDGTGRPSGEVVEELRRGYLWRGRVFRFALVRVAKS